MDNLKNQKIKVEIKELEKRRDGYKKKIKRGIPKNRYEIKISGKNNKEKLELLKKIFELVDNDGYIINYSQNEKYKLIIGNLDLYINDELKKKRKLFKKTKNKVKKKQIEISIELLKKSFLI